MARMGRGVLLFALLLVAFALVAPPQASINNGHPDHDRASQIESGVPQITFVAGQQAVEPTGYKRPCQNSAEDRQSDLCAQWKSADWTKIGTIFGILGIGALLYQICLTTRALGETGRATKAMREANELTRQANELEHRPIVVFAGFKVEETHWGLMVTPVFRNIGRLPAHPLECTTHRSFIEGPATEERLTELLAGHCSRRDDIGIVGINEPFEGGVVSVNAHKFQFIDRGEIPADVPEEYRADIDRYDIRTAALIVATVRYRAALGLETGEWSTRYIVPLVPRMRDDGKLRDDKWRQMPFANHIRMT